MWFDTEAEEAANFYLSVFKNNAKPGGITRYGTEGQEVHKKRAGTALTVEFTIYDQPFLALNGGPQFKFNESVSFMIPCDTQEEIDYYWDTLTKDGQESMCGWCRDKYGLWWQVVPRILPDMLKDPVKGPRVTKAYMQMRKFDIEKLKNA